MVFVEIKLSNTYQRCKISTFLCVYSGHLNRIKKVIGEGIGIKRANQLKPGQECLCLQFDNKFSCDYSKTAAVS